jgi:hypothetical protein
MKARTVLSSIPINIFSGETGEIKGFASSSIIDHNNKNILLSVAHYYDEKDIIGINLCAYQGFPNIQFVRPLYLTMKQLRKTAPLFLLLNKLFGIKYSRMSLVFKDAESPDIIYGTINSNIAPLHNDISSNLFNLPKIKLKIHFPCFPVKNEKYDFFGLKFINMSQGYINMENVYLSDLHYLKAVDNYYLFHTNYKDDIKGCSGSPILNEKGEIISMVAKKKGKKIWGVNLNIMKMIFDTI